jgi:tetratricopeptide (TPR) repeat protein
VTDSERLRLAGRWDDALTCLAGRDDLDAAIERVRILTEKNTFAEGAGEEFEDAIDTLAARAEGDRRIEALVLARRGLKLHSWFLEDRSRGEPPDELRLFDEALAIRRGLGDEGEIAESLFHVGLVHQVVRGDSQAALPYFEESYERAGAAGDELVASYAVRHLGFARQEAGDLDRAEEDFRESLELRRRAGWVSGVAAAELALVFLFAEQGRREEALSLAESVRETLSELGAARLLPLVEAQVDQLRASG